MSCILELPFVSITPSFCYALLNTVAASLHFLNVVRVPVDWIVEVPGMNHPRAVPGYR